MPIKIGNKFTKGDWTFEVIEKQDGVEGRVKILALGYADPSGWWLTREQADAITTWIKPTACDKCGHTL